MSPTSSYLDLATLASLGSVAHASMTTVVGCVLQNDAPTSPTLHAPRQFKFPSRELLNFFDDDDENSMAACLATPDENPEPGRVVERSQHRMDLEEVRRIRSVVREKRRRKRTTDDA